MGKEDRFKDPNWTGKFGLITGFIIILFNIIWVFLFRKHTPTAYISGAPIILGSIGIHYTIKKGGDFKVLLINVLAIIVGLLAPIIERILLKILLSK